MANETEYFVKDSDNAIVLTLTEASSPTALTWSSITFAFGGITITRTPATSGNGLTFSSGIATLTPAKLTEDLSNLTNKLHRVYITIVATEAPNGAIWGDNDTDTIVYFLVSDPT